MNIKVKSSGNFKNTETFLFNNRKSLFTEDEIKKIAEYSLDLFQKNTPSNSGKTSESWNYKIEKNNGKYVINIHNSNIQNGYNIAILVDEGHALKTGQYVSGKHYIDKTIKEIFEYVDNLK